MPSWVLNWTQILTLIASSLAALWAKQLANVKEEIIRAKNAQITMLKDELERVGGELSKCQEAPSRFKKYYDDSLAQYAEIHDGLQRKLEETVKQLDDKDREIRELLTRNTALTEHQRELLETRNGLQRQIGAIQVLAEQIKPIGERPQPEGSEGGSGFDPLGMAAQTFGAAMGQVGGTFGQLLKTFGIG
jgi:septal ring factor EnvC (AmiA/AmiB activator)